jgi:hypothetical protein
MQTRYSQLCEVASDAVAAVKSETLNLGVIMILAWLQKVIFPVQITGAPGIFFISRSWDRVNDFVLKINNACFK